MDKRDFDHLLSVQDDMADAVEDLAVLMRIKNLTTPEPLIETLNQLVDHTVASALKSCDLICELETLLEASFGGFQHPSSIEMPYLEAIITGRTYVGKVGSQS